jgi:hypothetical protein
MGICRHTFATVASFKRIENSPSVLELLHPDKRIHRLTDREADTMQRIGKFQNVFTGYVPKEICVQYQLRIEIGTICVANVKQ